MIGDKNCKIIVYSGSCINVVPSSLVSKIGLKMIPHLRLTQHLWRWMRDVLYLFNSQRTKIKFGVMWYLWMRVTWFLVGF